MGMCCWALVGAQGRYKLATTIATMSSLLITIPIGVIVSVWLRIDLQGLAFAVVTGDTVTATVLSTFLLMSNWEKISRKVQERVEPSSSSASPAFGPRTLSEKSCNTTDHVTTIL